MNRDDKLLIADALTAHADTLGHVADALSGAGDRGAYALLRFRAGRARQIAATINQEIAIPTPDPFAVAR